MPDHSLDEMLEQLYAADPADFIALRKQLQGELRTAGLKPEAALLAKARRPTTAMWAVNQLVRRQPELVESLLEHSEALRDAQTKALSGDRDAMRDAMRAHRAVIDEALQAALGVLGARANDGFREEIMAILRAASAQPEIGRELRLGRLVRTDDTTPGFPDLGDITPAPRPAKARAAKEPRPKPANAAPTEKERAEQEAARQARLEADRAHEAAAAADEAVAEAERRVDELSEGLRAARTDLRDLRTASRRARAEADRLHQHRSR